VIVVAVEQYQGINVDRRKMANSNNSDVKILAIVGMCGSGKSTLIEYLTERGVPKVYFGGVVLNAVKEAGLEINPETERMIREKLRAEEGKDFVVNRVLEEAKKLIEAGQKRIVLDGLYSWTEYNILRKEWPTEMTVIAIVVPKAIRRKRLAERPDRPFDAKAAAERDRSEIENLEKGGPIAIADYYLDNSGDVKTLHENFAKLLKEIEFLD
jgi:dephospho-CoA kinase